jgi:hypothetical protein
VTQISIDFTSKRPPEVQARIDEGMARADENADSRWKRVVDGAILAVARRQRELTVDEVLAEMATIPRAPTTHALDALGPAMRRAARDGIITATDKVVRSERPGTHGNRHTVWTSRYFK